MAPGRRLKIQKLHFSWSVAHEERKRFLCQEYYFVSLPCDARHRFLRVNAINPLTLHCTSWQETDAFSHHSRKNLIRFYFTNF